MITMRSQPTPAVIADCRNGMSMATSPKPKSKPVANAGLPPARRPRMAVFGGSFDPVHNGHLFLAGQIVRHKLADEVLFVPARQPPHKVGRTLTAAEHRLNMLKVALAPFPEFSVSDLEFERAEVLSYTFDTLEVLNQFFPEHELFFLMGTDCLVDLHQWHRATELVQRCAFLIYPRPGVPVPSYAVLAGYFGGRNARKLLNAIVDLRMVPIGATEFRADYAAGKSVAGQVPESAMAYIKDHGLYSAETDHRQQ